MNILETKQSLVIPCTQMNREILALTDAFLKLQLCEDMTNEDAEDIKQGLQALRNIHYAISTLNQIHHTLGTQRFKERYFNVVNDEVVEVERRDYVGSLDDTE